MCLNHIFRKGKLNLYENYKKKKIYLCTALNAGNSMNI